MNRTTSHAAAVLFLLLAALPAAADDSPQAIIERAIKAHGGQERLEKLKADRVTFKGTILINDKEATITGETTVNLPSQCRSVTKITVGMKTNTVVQILNGDDVIVTVDGNPQKMVAESAIAEMRDTLHLDRIARLAPLVTDKDKTFQLAALEESKVNDKPVVGVKVSTKGRADVKMYFDKDSGLLVKTEHMVEEGARKLKQEEFFSDFKEVDGYKRPTRTAIHRDGKKVSEIEEVEVKYLDKVDETLFTKP
jgi:hypothetical protein